MAINRNPDSMRNCAANIEKSVGLIEDAILDTTRALEIYADDLDYKTIEGIETFYANVQKLNTQLQEYKRLAAMLRKNADNISNLIHSTIF